MTMIIRRFQPSDFEAVLQLHVDGLNQFKANIGDPASDHDINHIETTYIRNGGDFLVGELDEKIVCMGAFKKLSPDIAEIKRIRVAQDFQRRGFGQRIIDALEELINERGMKQIILDTTDQQVPAQRLFEKNGYAELRRKEISELIVIFYKKKIDGRIS